MRRRLLPIVALVFAFALVAAACGGKTPATSSGSPAETSEASPTESEGGTITIGSDQANDHGSQDVSGASGSVEVEMDDFYFKPTTLQGTAGQTVKLELKNEGTALHNFTLEDQNIDQDVQPDGTESVEVTIPQSGSIEFFCKYHRTSGMAGQLTAA
jgi:plastocyanin